MVLCPADYEGLCVCGFCWGAGGLLLLQLVSRTFLFEKASVGDDVSDEMLGVLLEKLSTEGSL